MTFALIAHSKGGSSDTFSTTPGVDTTGANLLIVCLGKYADSDVPTISDNKGNTSWQALTAQIDGAVIAYERIYYHLSPAVGAGHTITFTAGGSFFGGACFAAFSGVAASSPLDQQTGATSGAGVNALNSGSITPTAAGCLIVSGLCTSNATADAAPAGFSVTDNAVWTSGGNEGAALAWVEQGAAAAISAAWTWPAGSACRGATTVASFKPAAVAQTGTGSARVASLGAVGSGSIAQAGAGSARVASLGAIGFGMGQGASGSAQVASLGAIGAGTMVAPSPGWTLVAHTAKQIEAPPGTTTAIDTTGANLLIVAISHYFDSAPPTVSDNKGNTANFVGLTAYGSGAIRIYYCANPTVGTGHTFTLGGTNSFYATIMVAAFNGAAGASPFDLQNGSSITSGASPILTGLITPSQIGELIISACQFTATVPTPAADPTLAVIDYMPYTAGSPAALGGALAWKTQLDASAVNVTWSWTGASNASAAIAAFKGLATTVGTASARIAVLGAIGAGAMNGQAGSGSVRVLSLGAAGTVTMPVQVATGSARVAVLGVNASGAMAAAVPGFTLKAHTKAASSDSFVTPAISTVGADLLLANVTFYAGSSPPTLADSQKNAWQALTPQSDSNISSRLFYVAAPTVSATHTFTLTETSGAFYGALTVAAFAGSDPVPFDKQAGATNAPVTSLSPGAVAPSQANELIVAGLGTSDNSSGATIDLGFTPSDVLDWSGTPGSMGNALAYLFQGQASPVNPTWTWTTAAHGAAVIASFKSKITENIGVGSARVASLGAAAVGGMRPVGTASARVALLGAAGIGTADSSVNAAVGVARVASLGAIGIGGQVVFGTASARVAALGAAAFGTMAGTQGAVGSARVLSLGAKGSGFATGETVASMVIQPSAKAFVLHTPGGGAPTLTLRTYVAPPVVVGEKLRVTVTLSGTTHVFTEDAATDKGNYVDPDGAFTQRCLIAEAATLPNFRVHFRPDLDGVRNEVVLEWGSCWAGLTPRVTTPTYQAIIFKGNTQLAAVTLPYHHYWSRWRWKSSDRPVRKTTAQLIAAGLIPNYSTSATHGFTPPSPPTSYTPMGRAGMADDMGGGGNDPNIGPITDYQGEYLCTGNNLASVLAQAEAAGTYPINYRDEHTGAPLDSFVNTLASGDFDFSGTPWLKPDFSLIEGTNPAGKVIAEMAHLPNPCYVPFLLTGDPYYLEGLHFWTNWGILNNQAAGRGFYNLAQVRAHAWTLRDALFSARVTPDSLPSWFLPKSYWQRYYNEIKAFEVARFITPGTAVTGAWQTFRVSNNSTWGDDDTGGAPFAGQIGGTPLLAGTQSHMWMEDYLGIVRGWARTLFPADTDWPTLQAWSMPNPVARTNGTSGWIRANPTAYKQIMRRTPSTPFATTWGESFTFSTEVFTVALAYTDANTLQERDFHYMGALRYHLLMGKRDGVSGASASYDWLDAQMLAISNSATFINWKFAVAP